MSEPADAGCYEDFNRSATPTWERWCLAGVFRDEAFLHALAAGTAALPG